MANQTCKVRGCNAVLKELAPQNNQKEASELYCPACHLSYNKHSSKLATLLPHIAKELRTR